MSTHPFEDRLDRALEQLRSEPPPDDDPAMCGFEHEVWSEIAIRDERAAAGRWGWFAAGARLRRPALAACMVLAVATGSLVGLTRANAYDREASQAQERRYVESIHPVMMSAEHSSHAGHTHGN